MATRIHVVERERNARWSAVLSEATERFGKPSASWPGFAFWCDPSNQKCIGDDHAGPRLTLTLAPHYPTDPQPGDEIEFKLDEGRVAADARYAGYATMAKRDPQGTRIAFDRCNAGVGQYKSNDDLMHHLVSIMSIGRKAEAPVFKPDAVPPAAYAALGFDAERNFGPGICFQSMDVFTEDDGDSRCKDYSMVGFRWARHVGNLWIVALEFGGNSLTKHYFVVSRLSDDHYRKVWWSDTLADFTTWLRQGAVPMREKPNS